MGNKKIIILIFLLTVFLGGGLRFYRLSFAPPSVNWDEASYAYNAFSLWKTGKDEYGNILPTSIRSFDDYKPPIYAYLTAPIVGIWGMNEITARIVSVIYGTITLVLLFIFAARISKNMTVGLISMVAFAISPILVHFSRLAFEGGIAMAYFVCTWIYFLKARSKYIYYFYGLFFALLSAFAYNSHKIYFGISLIWVIIGLGKKILIRKYLVLTGLLLLPMIYTSLFTPALARFSSTSIIPLFWQSKSIYLFGGELVNRYIAYYSPANLFIRGTNEPGQQVLGFAVFFPFMFIGWINGIINIFRNTKHKILIYWMILTPIPAVLTWNWFTPVRVVPYWGIVCVIIGIGFFNLYKNLNKIWKPISLFLFGGVALIYTIWLFSRIQYTMPYTQYGRWQWGFREAMELISPIQDKYEKIIWDTPQAQPYIFILFYSQYSANKYQGEIDPQTRSGQPRKIYDFGKYNFRKIYWPKDRDLKKTLFIGDPYALPESDLTRDGAKIIGEVRSPEGYIIYRLVTK